MQLHTKILLGLVLGALLGPLMGDFAVALEPFGQAFIRLLIMIVIPLVMASLIIGTASLGDLKKLGRIGLKTVGYYVVATALAVALESADDAFPVPPRTNRLPRRAAPLALSRLTRAQLIVLMFAACSTSSS